MPVRTLTFAETASGVTYTAVTSIPPGARLLDVLVETTAAWTAATADLTIADNEAEDALASAYDITSEGFSTAANTGGTAWGNGDGDGAPYSAGEGSGTGKLYPTGSEITAVVTAGTPGGPTGVTVVTLVLETPTTARRATVV